jgi:hypothetical protein
MKTRRIPTLSAAATVMLARDLERAGASAELPEAVRTAQTEMLVACSALEQRRKSARSAGPDDIVPLEAIRRTRTAVSAFREAVAAFARLRSASTQRSQASVVQDRLFGAGSAFVGGPVDDLVLGAEALLDNARAKENAEVLGRLGLGVFIKELKSALHDVAQARAAKTDARGSTAPQGIHATALASLRAYVAKVESAGELSLVDASELLRAVPERTATRKLKVVAPAAPPVASPPAAAANDEESGPNSRAA